jgi:hypothetical protein
MVASEAQRDNPGAVIAQPVHASANHHCATEQAIYATKRLVIARELTEDSDIFVTCWRATNKHRVVTKFRAAEHEDPAFRANGSWVVWRYRREQRDRMGSMNAHTGRRGPAVSVPVPSPDVGFRLGATGGPPAQDVGDADVMLVFIATSGDYAWPVSGLLPDAEGGGSATAMYEPDGHGGDVRIDFGAGPDALRRIRISGVTLRWSNNGATRHARLTRRS